MSCSFSEDGSDKPILRRRASELSPHFLFFSPLCPYVLLLLTMVQPALDDGSPRSHKNQATQTTADEDGWLVRGLVFSLRVFFVFFVAFARAVVIVARDKIPDTLLEQAIPPTVFIDPSSTHFASSSLGSLEASRTSRASYADMPRSTSSEYFYVVFIGREVGYTSSW